MHSYIYKSFLVMKTYVMLISNFWHKAKVVK